MGVVEVRGRGGVRAVFWEVEGEGQGVSREVGATGVAALAVAEGKFGGRGVRGAVRVGERVVAGVEVWVEGG